MNQALAAAIVDSLRVIDPPVDAAPLADFSQRDWRHALQWLDWSGLALLFWNRLGELHGQHCVPEEIGTQLDRGLADHRHRIADMAAEFDQINSLFESAGVRYAVLKGFALIPEYCPDAILRTTYDYDYLAGQESVQRAIDVLASEGYVRKDDPEPHPAVYFRAARPPFIPSSRSDCYSLRLPRTVDLHWRLWEPDILRIPLRLPDDVMDRLRQRTCLGLRFCALSEEDELLFQVLHTFRHMLRNWCRLCSFHEIAYFLDQRSSDAAFWQRFSERIQGSSPLQEITGVVFSLARELFGITIPSQASAVSTKRMRVSLVNWVKFYGRDSALSNFSENKFTLFLQREFVEDEAAWRDLRRNCLFPIHRPNEAAQASSAEFGARVRASWRQTLYVVQRLAYHVTSAARYGWQCRRWRRLRAKGDAGPLAASENR